MGQLQQGGGQKADPCLYSEAGTSSCLGDWFHCPSLALLPDLSCPGLSKVTKTPPQNQCCSGKAYSSCSRLPAGVRGAA